MWQEVKRNFILQQGFEEPAPAACPRQYSALHFQPRTVFVWIVAGILFHSPARQAVFLTAAGQDASGGVIREELAAVHPHRRDHAVPAHACGPARACGRCVQPRQRGRNPGTVAIRLAPVSRSCTCASTGSPWSAFHGGHRPGRCRQPGEPGFPPACASAAATGCIPGCTPRAGRPGITDRALPAVTSSPPSSLRSSATAWRRRSATTRLSDDGWRGRSLLRRGRCPWAG